MEKEELLLPVQARVNSSHRLSHSPRYAPLSPTSTVIKEKQMKETKRKKRKKIISKGNTLKKKKIYINFKKKIRSVTTAIVWFTVFTTRGFEVDEMKRRQLNIKEATQKWRFRFLLDSDDAPPEAGLASRPSLGPISE